MQLMLEKPDLAKELGVQSPTGILLKGPPGTGKTTIARILAHEAKCNFYAITPADINQMYVGESEKRVHELFARARANPPAIIFVDEIDALLPNRQGGVAIHSDKVVNQFLQEMDGLTPNSRIFIVGATNRPDMLDPALRRGGRLSREIEVPLPDLEARNSSFRSAPAMPTGARRQPRRTLEAHPGLRRRGHSGAGQRSRTAGPHPHRRHHRKRRPPRPLHGRLHRRIGELGLILFRRRNLAKLVLLRHGQSLWNLETASPAG